MSTWLLSEDAAHQLAEARRLGLKPSPEQLAAFNERVVAPEARDGELPRNMRLAGSVAEIRVEGVLTKTPDILAFFFGGGNTTYRSIMTSLAIAKSDPAIRSVVLYVDSPGGTVDGLFDMLAALETFRDAKPLSVKAENALSAAYGIAAAAGRIEATNAGARFGSVGVAASYAVWDFVVDITNTESPDKRPNVKTEEGKAVVRRELDAIHDLFVDAIGRGRGVTADEVKEKFGRGATLLASEAKRRGMIDSIAKPALRAVGSVQAPAAHEGGAQEGERHLMDMRILKAQHPELYEAAVQDGVKTERDRVTAHLTLGKPAGTEGLNLAIDLIEKGEGMTLTANARYQALAMARSARTVRQQESDAAGSAVDNAQPPAPPAETNSPSSSATQPAAPKGDLGDQVVAKLRERGYPMDPAPSKEVASAHR